MERHIHFHRQSQKYRVRIWDRESRKVRYFGLYGSLELARIAKRKALAKMDEDPEKIIRECADVANFAMMIADNARNHELG